MKRKLEINNAHLRDDRVVFNEELHTYTVDGKKFKGSVSSFWGEFFDHFKPIPVIRKCYSRWKTTADQKYGYFILYMVVVQGVRTRENVLSLLESFLDGLTIAAIIKRFPFLEGEVDQEDFLKKVKNNESELGDKGYFYLIKYLTSVVGLDDEGCKKQIAHFWSSLGTKASSEGTNMHLQLELKNNDEKYDAAMHEVKLYMDFVRDHPWLEPFRTEWSVFSTEAQLAGQIDLVVQDTRFSPPKYYIIDFKRCKELLTPSNPYGKFGKVPFHQVPDTAYGHYSVQQTAYRWFLETLYGITISKCYLLQLHPCMQKYHFIRLPNLRINFNIAIQERIRSMRSERTI